MGLSRRMFTKEFKLAAVQRLEQGVSLGEVARALEVNPNVLHRWRREIRQGPGNAFPGNGKQRWSEGRIADLILFQPDSTRLTAVTTGWCLMRNASIHLQFRFASLLSRS
jgi:transposase